MPIYEYKCSDCGQRIERLQRVGDAAPDACEACGGAMERQISAPAFQFKGTGWYVTDYAGRKGESSDGPSSSSDRAGDTSAEKDTGAKTKDAGGDDTAATAPAAKTGTGAATASKSDT